MHRVEGVAGASVSYGAVFTFDSSATALGSRGDGGAGTFWGLLDELGLYNRALSASEIQGIFNAGGTGQTKPQALGVTSLEVNPATVTGGQGATGTVKLNGIAPSGGTVVTLSKDAALTAVTLPASVTVSGGATTATFAITTSAVAAAQSAGIKATLGTSSAGASFAVQPTAAHTLTLNPTSVVGGSAVAGLVTLPSPAPAGGTVVTLSSSNSGVANPAVSSITVPAGSTSRSFTVNTSTVSASTSVNITATINGIARSQALTVQPASGLRLTLSISPDRVDGGVETRATVTLSAPAPSGGATITISGAHPAAQQQQASLLIGAGSRSGSFLIRTNPVLGIATGSFTVSYAGASASAALTVLPPRVVIFLLPGRWWGGIITGAVVTLARPAPTGGATFQVSSSNPAAVSPAVGSPPNTTLRFSAGQQVAAFAITTYAVNRETPVTLRISGYGLFEEARITLIPR